MVLVSYHATLSVLKGRHEGNEEEDCGCSNDKSTSDYIISEEFNHQIPNAPKKNRLPVVAYEITAATNPIIATRPFSFSARSA